MYICAWLYSQTALFEICMRKSNKLKNYFHLVDSENSELMQVTLNTCDRIVNIHTPQTTRQSQPIKS